MQQVYMVFETKQSSNGYNFDHYVDTFANGDDTHKFISDREYPDEHKIKRVNVRDSYVSIMVDVMIQRREKLLQELADLDRDLMDEVSSPPYA